MRRKMSLRRFENRLSTRRTHLIREIERRLKESRDFSTHRLSDLADMASNTSSDELLWLVVAEERRELEQIDEALARIKAGSYGICRSCEQPIKKARLEALPFATLCVKCKEVEEEAIELESRAEVAETPTWGSAVASKDDEARVKGGGVKERIKEIETVDKFSQN